MSDKPPYIYRDGGMMFAPPYLQADTFLCGWMVPSDRSAQQKLLDETVNRALAGSDLRYQAVFPRLMLSFADIKQVTSLAPEHASYGFVVERDVTIWFLAAARRGDTIERLVWFLPYIWVDDPLAVVVGREVFGFPKHLARMNIPTHRRDEGPFLVEAPALATHRTDTRATWQSLLEVRPSSREAIGADDEQEFEPLRPEPLADLFEQEEHPAVVGDPAREGLLASAGNLCAQFVANLRQEQLPILFLKQFPDAAQAGRACYQRVIEAPARITKLDRLGVMRGRWTAELHSHASHRLPETLGLPARSIDLGRAIYLQYSFSMDLGQEIG